MVALFLVVHEAWNPAFDVANNRIDFGIGRVDEQGDVADFIAQLRVQLLFEIALVGLEDIFAQIFIEGDVGREDSAQNENLEHDKDENEDEHPPDNLHVFLAKRNRVDGNRHDSLHIAVCVEMWHMDTHIESV